MGNWNYNNYVVEVLLREGVTDTRYNVLFEMKPTVDQFDSYCANFIKTPAYHPLAEKIIRYFMVYDSGKYMPDRYSCYEPVRQIFDKNDITVPISYLAYPAGELYLKKMRGIDILITNNGYGFSWKNNVFLVPRRTLPECLTEIKCYFPIKKGTKIETIIQLLHDLKVTFNSDNGKVYVQCTHEIVAE